MLELRLGPIEQQDLTGACRILEQRDPGLEDKFTVAGIVQQRRLHLQGFVQDAAVDMPQFLLRLDADQLLDIGGRCPGKGYEQCCRNGRRRNQQRLAPFRLLLPQRESHEGKDHHE